MKYSTKRLLTITLLIMATTTQAEQSGFITPEQSAKLFKKQAPTAVATKNNASSTTTVGYLGIGFDTVPLAIRAHLPANIGKHQGLIVTRFADDSPAADDGMNVHDVLLTYDGQPIEKPEDFIQKIRNDKPKRVVTFTLLRQGQVITLPVTMGAQTQRKQQQPTTVKTPIQYTSPQAQQRQLQQGQAIALPPPAANFNGLAIRKIGNDVYDASIGFIGRDGKPTRRSYKGNRMQILQQIMQANDLPPQTKQQLLFAVQPRQQKTTGWRGMPTMPFGNNGGFNPNQFFKGWGW